MNENREQEQKYSFTEVVLEAIKGIKSEILLYGVVVVGLLAGSANLGIEVLRELKWPLLGFATLILIAYFIARAIPKAKLRLRNKAPKISL